MNRSTIDKTAIVIKKQNEEQSDLGFWLSKSVDERLHALESLRRQFFSYSHYPPPRLQRVYRIVKQK